MENITRTIGSAYLQTVQWIGARFVMKQNSTLNEKWNIQSGIAPGTNDMPRIKAYGIGNGGHDLIVVNGIAKPRPTQFKTRNASLYKHMPFVLRLPEADLTVDERSKYAMRRIEDHNGTNYVAYYLKRIDFTNVVPVINYHQVVEGGDEVVTAFNYTTDDLNPVAPALSPTGTNIVSGDYLSASAPVSIALTAADVEELINVAQIIWNDADLAIVSEMCLVSGVDKTVASPSVGNSTINFVELIAAQVCTMINVFYPMNFNNQGVDIALDLGATEPLFSLTSS
jgi:hypothetical protein